MAKKTMLHEAVTVLVPYGKRGTTRKKVITLATVAANMLATLAMKRPVLMPVLLALQGLMAPSNDSADKADDSARHAKFVLVKIRRLKKKLEGADDAAQDKIRRKLEGLYELLIEDGDDNDT